MLDANLKKQVQDLFAQLDNQYTLDVKLNSNHQSAKELMDLLSDVADCSDKVDISKHEGEGLEFTILKNHEDSNIYFKAVPNGHEFTTLLLAILNLDGKGKNLPDEAIINRIKNLVGEIQIESYISLTCTNCPEVVQSINIFSIYNPNVKHYIIDGGINKEEVEQKGIQAVPTVFADGEQLIVGRSNLVELLDKLEEKYGSKQSEISQEKTNYDVVIIGGGPAGITSAIYSARKGFSVALLADKIGGQVNETLGIENLISKPYTTGKELSADFRKHLDEYDIDIYENRNVIEVNQIDGINFATTSMNEKFASPALIFATGASWRKLGVEGEEKYIGNGVAFCTHCDGPFYKDKKVVVVGGGNSGLEGAIDLSSLATHVTVLEFADSLKADEVLIQKVNEIENIDLILNAQTLSIEGDGQKVSALKYKDRLTDTIQKIDTEGIFIQIGLKPNSQLLKDLVDINTYGEIKVDEHCRTSQQGIYAAGDVTTVPYKQIVVAMGEGSKAALSAFDDKIKGKIKSKSTNESFV